MKFPVSKIRPNPFRDLDFNGFDPHTITGLMASIEDTGFWANVTGRVADDGVEIAYGHHRIEAIKRLYGDDYELEIAIADLDDRQMLKMMIAENINQRGNAAANEFETARALIHAIASGRIEVVVPEDAHEADIRYAPSFCAPKPGDVAAGPAYTFEAVSSFFNWDDRKSRYIFGALELDELGILPIGQLMGMGTSAVRQLVEATRNRLQTAERAQKREDERIVALEEEIAKTPMEPAPEVKEKIQAARVAKSEHLTRANRDIKETASTVRDQLEKREITTRAIKEVAREIELKNSDTTYTPPPPSARYVSGHKRRVEAFFEGNRGDEIDQIVGAAREIALISKASLDQVVGLSKSLRVLAEKSTDVATSLEEELAGLEDADFSTPLPENEKSTQADIDEDDAPF